MGLTSVLYIQLSHMRPIRRETFDSMLESFFVNSLHGPLDIREFMFV